MSNSRKLLLLPLLLFLVTAGLYWPTTRHDFSVLDDDDYVTANPWVNQGVSIEATRWAFTTFWAANWHPLTWLSHQADCSLYGMFAGGHHLTNLLLHALNTLLLFLLLRKLTGSTGRSWIVAALFGWHPLRVESVAWIAERKDLLSTLCLLGVIFAYHAYAKRRDAQNDETGNECSALSIRLYYCLALLIFAAGLMCKPMLVTLPCLLLLLDYWPLQRFPGLAAKRNGMRLVVEKIPFFMLSAAGCLVTLAAQRAGGAVKDTHQVSLIMRALNALSAYAQYLFQTIWPNPLCIYYPITDHPPLFAAIAGALLLTSISFVAFRFRRNFPWLVTGWLWFIGTLVPVIGLVQVGTQAHADRYTYIPSIGLYIALVWLVHRGLTRMFQTASDKAGSALAAMCLLACLVLTGHQLGYWKNSVKLFSHSLAHTPNNAFAQNDLGVAYFRLGETKEAMVHYREAIRLNPTGPHPYYNLGTLQAGEGDLHAAGETLSQALKYSPHNESLLNNLGVVLAQQGKYDEALGHFREAIQYNPSYPKSYLNAGAALQALGQAGPAFTNYNIALRMEPGSFETRRHLAYLLATCPDASYRQPQQAVRLAEQAAMLSGNLVPEYLQTLALTYGAAGQYGNAAAAEEKALTIAKARGATNLVGRLQVELETYRAGKTPEYDWKRMQ